MSEKKDNNLNSPSKFNDEMKTVLSSRQPTALEKTQMTPLQAMIAEYGVPRMMITGFLLLLFIMTPFVGVNLPMQITNVINRFSWNAVLVLAMVPMIHSGCGLNFGLPLGVISGLLGGTLSIQLGFERFGAMGSFLMAILIATPFAKAAGINVDRIRTLSVVMSTWLGAIGILIYQQGFGFLQLYNAPNNLTLPTVSAILIGGALVNKATIGNVIIGTILFQGMVTLTPTVMNAIVHMDMSEVIRNIVSNGMILYALTRKTEGTK